MEEIWKDIEDFPGYQVSDLGRIRSRKLTCANGRHGKDECGSDWHIMSTTSDDGNGYLKVMLRKNNKSYCRKIHRLVAEAFIDNPEHLDTVDHISNNKLDNSVHNLQWLSRYDNLAKAYRDGLHDARFKARQKSYLITDVYTNEDYIASTREEAADFLECSESSISHGLRYQPSFRIKDYVVRYLKTDV